MIKQQKLNPLDEGIMVSNLRQSISNRLEMIAKKVKKVNIVYKVPRKMW